MRLNPSPYIRLGILFLLLIGFLIPINAQRRPGGGVFRPPGGGVLDPGREPVSTNSAYFIKSKGTQKVMDVASASTAAGAQVWQYDLNGTIAQKFIFEKSPTGAYYIRTMTGGHYVTTVMPLVFSDGSPSTSNGINLIQTTLYQATTPPRLGQVEHIGQSNADDQLWQLQASNESGCFFLTNKRYPTLALQPRDATTRAPLILVTKDPNSNLQKWIFKSTTMEDNPNSAESENGLVVDCSATLTAFWFFKSRKDIAKIFPEWRAVGENFTPNGSTIAPKESYRILEGEVMEDAANVAFEDFPTAHFTHDMTFHVNPDPAYRYLLGETNGVVQSNIEVEWESGLAQGNHASENPAATLNRRGDSFGFFSAGHQRYDNIWNWPTPKDWVHVQGNWVWDRGHPPARTEIHPPRFIAIKRHLPDKFNLPTGGFVYTTRCDLFANGDGNIIYNNKGLHPYTQKVKMSERVYTVYLRHDLPRPNANAHLKAEFVKQRGDTYTGTPMMEVFENGTADIPEPHVRFTLPWAVDRVSDRAVFARTLHLYWDDVPTHGVPSNYAMKIFRVTLEKIFLLDKSEGNDSDPGEYRLFANIGNNWVFVNEFVGVNDILSTGLGDAWDPNYCLRYPTICRPGQIPQSSWKYDFNFNVAFEIYVPPGKQFRMYTAGWEADYIDGQFGRIINPFLSCEDARKTLEGKFSGSDYIGQGGLDDGVGAATVTIGYNDTPLSKYDIESKGDIDNSEVSQIGANDPNKSFRATYKVEIIR